MQRAMNQRSMRRTERSLFSILKCCLYFFMTSNLIALLYYFHDDLHSEGTTDSNAGYKPVPGNKFVRVTSKESNVIYKKYANTYEAPNNLIKKYLVSDKTFSNYLTYFYKENSTKGQIEEFVSKQSEYQVSYPSFKITEPQFIDNSDKERFFINENNIKVLKGFYSKETKGVVKIIRSGWFSEHYECSMSTDFIVFSHRTGTLVTQSYTRFLFPLAIKDSCTFHRFLLEVLPKVIQVRALTDLKNVTLLVWSPCDDYSQAVLGMLGIKHDQLMHYKEGYYPSTYQINSCKTPIIHPVLYENARKLMNIAKLGNGRVSNFVVVFVSGMLHQRKVQISNLAKVTDMLADRFGVRLKIFQDPYPSVVSVVKTLARASIIIGVHSNAMHFAFFAPHDASVIEIMPLRKDGSAMWRGPYSSQVWQMTSAIGQRYWRTYEGCPTEEGQVKVSIGKLSEIIEKIEPSGRFTNPARKAKKVPDYDNDWEKR